MNTLTENQKILVEKKNIALQEKYIAKNKSILFDIKKVVKKGEEIRAQFDNLELRNELTKQIVKKQFDIDVEKVRKFLGEYADALVTFEDEIIGWFEYSIGFRDGHKVYVNYSYGNDSWRDYDEYSAIFINEVKYQQYQQRDIEVFMEGYDTESFDSFEKMFNDNDVIRMFEDGLEDYIIYHKKVEKELGINRIKVLHLQSSLN